MSRDLSGRRAASYRKVVLRHVPVVASAVGEEDRPRNLYPRIRNAVYPLLRREPQFGPNIKRLLGEFSDFYRYRLGDYRLFYTIDEQDTVVVVADLRSRQTSYRRR